VVSPLGGERAEVICQKGLFLQGPASRFQQLMFRVACR
jgi:hypothetical protein